MHDLSVDMVIIGAGPAGRAAASIAPGATVLARPDATVWHAEPGRLWIETSSGVCAVRFTGLLLCADEPLLLLALGCAFGGGRPAVDARGETSVAGVFAAGRILGATTAMEAERQARIAAAALCGAPVDGEIGAVPPAPEPEAARLDPLELAQLLATAPGPARNQAALAQLGVRGPALAGVPAPARPVGFRALAAMAPASPVPGETQQDLGALP